MKLNQKLILMFVSALVLIIAIMLVYATYFLPVGVNLMISELKNKVNRTEITLINALSISDDFRKTIEEIHIDDSMIIVIENIDGSVILTYPSDTSVVDLDQNSNLYITSADNFFVNNSNGTQLYFIKVMMPASEQSNLTAFHDVTGMFVQRMLITSILVLMVVLAAFIAAIRRVVIKPLEELSDKINNYGYSDENAKKDKGDEIKRLHADFDAMTKTLDDEEKKQMRIIASISHDIKTPLTSIMGYAEQLKKGSISSERNAKYINTIYNKSLAIKEMVESFDDYLSYNRKSSSAKEEVTVKQLLNAVNTYYMDDLERAGVTFTIDSKCNDEKIYIDESKILRIFGNLIDNSVKHKRSEPLQLRITAERVKEKVLFCVSDNGEGVAEEKLEKIFEPLYTTDESRSKNVSGLGLSISTEIIEAHGGEIWATKSPMNGLSVWFSIPVC